MIPLEVNHHFQNGGSFWKMITPTKTMVVRKPPYKKWWLDFQGFPSLQKTVRRFGVCSMILASTHFLTAHLYVAIGWIYEYVQNIMHRRGFPWNHMFFKMKLAFYGWGHLT